MKNKRNPIAGGGLNWPTIELLHRKRIPRISMRLDGFVLFAQDCGILETSPQSTSAASLPLSVAASSSRPVSPAARLELSLADLVEAFNHVVHRNIYNSDLIDSPKQNNAARTVSQWSSPLRSNSQSSRVNETKSSWKVLSQSTSKWQQLSGGPLKRKLAAETHHLDFDGFTQALCLLAQRLFLLPVRFTAIVTRALRPRTSCNLGVHDDRKEGDDVHLESIRK